MGIGQLLVTLSIPARSWGSWAAPFSHPLAGPSLALALLLVVFSVSSDRFLSAANFSLILQQTLVLAALALGQTLVILTAGIDLSLGALAVFGTIIATRLAVDGQPVVGIVAALVAIIGLSALNGALVAWVGLPPFIVTLGTFTAVTAATYLTARSQTTTVPEGPLTLLGEGMALSGGFFVSWSIPLLLLLYAVLSFSLGRTAWGNRVYATGSDANAARLAGVDTRRVTFSVYLVAGALYAVAAWMSLGRIPSADPNAMQNMSLQSITAVVLGGTSFFGGRGLVVGTLIGALIVGVLRNGLTLAGIDSLYQDVVTGVLIVVAVSLDKISRRSSR